MFTLFNWGSSNNISTDKSNEEADDGNKPLYNTEINNKTAKKKKRKNKKKKETSAVNLKSQGNDNDYFDESFDSQDEQDISRVAKVNSNLMKPLKFPNLPEVEDFDGIRSNNTTEPWNDPIQVVVNEVYQKLNKTAVKSQQQAVVSLETIRSCVLEMWENHLPYDNVDHVINALNKLKEISGAELQEVSVEAPTADSSTCGEDTVSTQYMSMMSLENSTNVIATTEAVLSEDDLSMIARLEQVAGHPVLEEALSALVGWVDVTKQTQLQELAATGVPAAAAVNTAGDLLFRSRALELLLTALQASPVEGTVILMATLLAQVLPLHLSTQVYSSDVETLSKILAKFVERLHDSPVAVREVAAAHAVAALGKQRQFVATGAISRSGNGGKDDPLILNLIANETHFRELAHSLGSSDQMTSSAVNTYSAQTHVNSGQQEYIELTNIIGKLVENVSPSETLTMPVLEEIEVAELQQLEESTALSVQSAQNEVLLLQRRKEETEMLLHNIITELNTKQACLEIFHHQHDDAVNQLSAANRKQVSDSPMIVSSKNNYSVVNFVEDIVDFESKCQQVLMRQLQIQSLSPSTSDTSHSPGAIGTYLESLALCLSSLSQRCRNAYSAQHQLKSEFLMYESLGMKGMSNNCTVQVGKLEGDIRQLTTTASELQREFAAVVSRINQIAVTNSQVRIELDEAADSLAAVIKVLADPESTLAVHEHVKGLGLLAEVSSSRLTQLNSTSQALPLHSTVPVPSSSSSGSSGLKKLSSGTSLTPGRARGNSSFNNNSKVKTSKPSNTNVNVTSGSSAVVFSANGNVRLNLNNRGGTGKAPSTMSLVDKS